MSRYPPSAVPTKAKTLAHTLQAWRAAPSWHDWRWQLRHAIRAYHPLLAEFGLDQPTFARIHQRYPLCITPYALSLLTPRAPRDPLNLQALPAPDELENPTSLSPDPFGEQSASAPVHGLKQRYPDRVLLMSHDVCAMNCRHCTRKNMLGNVAVVRTAEERGAALAWVRSHPAVREVLISGGDPGVLPDTQLLRLVRDFARLPQIDAVRIGTRVLASLPMRVTPRLAAMLGASRKVWINTQFNHARELTPEAVAACALLIEAGIPLSNQSVLLRGVNDSADTLFQLCAALQRHRIRPYYLFQCDPVAGTAHFHVPLATARRLEEELATRLGGLALPRFVRDLPGTPRKTPL